MSIVEVHVWHRQSEYFYCLGVPVDSSIVLSTRLDVWSDHVAWRALISVFLPKILPNKAETYSRLLAVSANIVLSPFGLVGAFLAATTSKKMINKISAWWPNRLFWGLFPSFPIFEKKKVQSIQKFCSSMLLYAAQRYVDLFLCFVLGLFFCKTELRDGISKPWGALMLCCFTDSNHLANQPIWPTKYFPQRSA